MLHNKQFIYLLIGQTTANLGDVFYTIAIISIIYSSTGSAFYASFVTFTMTISIFISSILTPMILDKFHLNQFLTSTQFLKTILLLLVWLYLISFSTIDYWMIFLFFICISFLDGFANPIKQSLIPHYVPSEELMKANSLSESINEVMQVGNWLIGGSMLLWFSSADVILFSLGLYVMATLSFSRLKKVDLPEKKESNSKIAQATEGFSLFAKKTDLRTYLIIDSLESIAAPVWNSSILLVYVTESIQEESNWWGWINAAFFVGMILSSLIMYRLTDSVQKNINKIIILGVMITSLATFLFGYTTISSLALASSLFVGVGTQLKGIPLQTMFQQTAPKEKLAVLYAAEGSFLTPLLGLTSLLVGFLADRVSISFVYYLSALILLIGSIPYFYLLNQYQQQPIANNK